MLALRLPKELEDRLEAMAKKTGRTKSYYAREAIIEHIQDLEDYYLAEHRLGDKPEFVELDDAIEELGLTGEDIVSTGSQSGS